ncbi:MAG: response regulator [Patescibacteria group bacterium]|nr:response regulator [Patescibacteria group bacterium]
MKTSPSTNGPDPSDPLHAAHPDGILALPPDVNIANPKILIVDDDTITVRVFRKYLWEANYRNLVSTSNAEQTLEMVARESPDVILLDVLMPGVSGLEILSAIRGDRNHADIPVIILTASTERETKLQALARGVTDFLQKPVDPCEMIPRVRNALRIKAFTDYYRAHSVFGGSQAAARTGTEEGSAEYAGKRPQSVQWRPAELRWPAFEQARVEDLKANAKILIVDDEPINIKVIQKLLAGEGYTKTASTSQATDAISAVYREVPDLVLLDIMMPKISGLEILEKIREDDEMAGLPVIILTASTDQGTKRQAFDLGATDFLSKPVDSLDLLPRVRNALIVKLHHDHLRDYAEALECEIAEQIKALEAHTIALEQANEMLRRSRDIAQRAERMKSQFLANMSHEIRTPLTAIIGFSDELLRDIQDSAMSETHVAHVKSIVRNGQHLLGVINDVLDLSRIEAGCLSVEICLCSPAEICSEVVGSFQVLAARKGVALSLHFEGPLPEVIQTDPICIRRILTNLIGNALKFTEKGSVDLRVRLMNDPKEPAIEFQVTDTGIGIHKSHLSQLFRPFVQGDDSVGRRYGGTGLGLTISKHLAERLQGSIGVESEFGKGSTFRVILPTGPLDGVKLLDDPSAAADGAEAEKNRARPASAVKLNCRILLAEDSADNQRLISLILNKAGAEVEIAENGEIALEMAMRAANTDKPFDLILMDMEMPVLDGRTAVRHLRARGYVGPIIALTAHAMSGEREKCLEAGCDDYATKPIDREKLISRIFHYINPQAKGFGAALEAELKEIQVDLDRDLHASR